MAPAPLYEKFGALFLTASEPEEMKEDYSDAGGGVLIIGFGRFGQIVAQPLFARGCDVTILDVDTHRINEAKSFGCRIHFGDGSRRDVLRAAGAKDASVILDCVDDVAAANKIVELGQLSLPKATPYVRSRDRVHSIELRRNNVEFAVRETFESALRMGELALEAVGVTKDEAHKVIADIRERDRVRLMEQVEGDIHSGLERLHVKAVKPQPLPRRE